MCVHFILLSVVEKNAVKCHPTLTTGAMENKSLNIFNSRLVLATPQTATDADYAAIEVSARRLRRLRRAPPRTAVFSF